MDYLHAIADAEALSWIVTEQRTAFRPSRAVDAYRLAPGDRLFLYTTRACFGNPPRDRGRVIGSAIVTGRADVLKSPVSFGDRSYSIGVRFKIERLCPRREGLELGPLVASLATFPRPESWGMRLRRALVPLRGDDGEVLARALAPLASSYRAAVRTYKPE